MNEYRQHRAPARPQSVLSNASSTGKKSIVASIFSMRGHKSPGSVLFGGGVAPAVNRIAIGPKSGAQHYVTNSKRRRRVNELIIEANEARRRAISLNRQNVAPSPTSQLLSADYPGLVYPADPYLLNNVTSSPYNHHLGEGGRTSLSPTPSYQREAALLRSKSPVASHLKRSALSDLGGGAQRTASLRSAASHRVTAMPGVVHHRRSSPASGVPLARLEQNSSDICTSNDESATTSSSNDDDTHELNRLATTELSVAGDIMRPTAVIEPQRRAPTTHNSVQYSAVPRHKTSTPQSPSTTTTTRKVEPKPRTSIQGASGHKKSAKPADTTTTAKDTLDCGSERESNLQPLKRGVLNRDSIRRLRLSGSRKSSSIANGGANATANKRSPQPAAAALSSPSHHQATTKQPNNSQTNSNNPPNYHYGAERGHKAADYVTEPSSWSHQHQQAPTTRFSLNSSSTNSNSNAYEADVDDVELDAAISSNKRHPQNSVEPQSDELRRSQELDDIKRMLKLMRPNETVRLSSSKQTLVDEDLVVRTTTNRLHGSPASKLQPLGDQPRPITATTYFVVKNEKPTQRSRHHQATKDKVRTAPTSSTTTKATSESANSTNDLKQQYHYQDQKHQDQDNNNMTPGATRAQELMRQARATFERHERLAESLITKAQSLRLSSADDARSAGTISPPPGFGNSPSNNTNGDNKRVDLIVKRRTTSARRALSEERPDLEVRRKNLELVRQSLGLDADAKLPQFERDANDELRKRVDYLRGLSKQPSGAAQPAQRPTTASANGAQPPRLRPLSTNWDHSNSMNPMSASHNDDKTRQTESPKPRLQVATTEVPKRPVAPRPRATSTNLDSLAHTAKLQRSNSNLTEPTVAATPRPRPVQPVSVPARHQQADSSSVLSTSSAATTVPMRLVVREKSAPRLDFAQVEQQPQVQKTREVVASPSNLQSAPIPAAKPVTVSPPTRPSLQMPPNFVQRQQQVANERPKVGVKSPDCGQRASASSNDDSAIASSVSSPSLSSIQLQQQLARVPSLGPQSILRRQQGAYVEPPSSLHMSNQQEIGLPASMIQRQPPSDDLQLVSTSLQSQASSTKRVHFNDRASVRSFESLSSLASNSTTVPNPDAAAFGREQQQQQALSRSQQPIGSPDTLSECSASRLSSDSPDLRKSSSEPSIYAIRGDPDGTGDDEDDDDDQQHQQRLHEYQNKTLQSQMAVDQAAQLRLAGQYHPMGGVQQHQQQQQQHYLSPRGSLGVSGPVPVHMPMHMQMSMVPPPAAAGPYHQMMASPVQHQLSPQHHHVNYMSSPASVAMMAAPSMSHQPGYRMAPNSYGGAQDLDDGDMDYVMKLRQAATNGPLKFAQQANSGLALRAQHQQHHQQPHPMMLGGQFAGGHTFVQAADKRHQQQLGQRTTFQLDDNMVNLQTEV